MRAGLAYHGFFGPPTLTGPGVGVEVGVDLGLSSSVPFPPSVPFNLGNVMGRPGKTGGRPKVEFVGSFVEFVNMVPFNLQNIMGRPGVTGVR